MKAPKVGWGLYLPITLKKISVSFVSPHASAYAATACPRTRPSWHRPEAAPCPRTSF